MFTKEELTDICGLARVRAMIEGNTQSLPDDKCIFYKYLLIGVDEAMATKASRGEEWDSIQN